MALALRDPKMGILGREGRGRDAPQEPPKFLRGVLRGRFREGERRKGGKGHSPLVTCAGGAGRRGGSWGGGGEG